jgi:activator of HSP90 ATPase
MAFEFSVSDVIPATPRAIYDAWLSSEGHAAITGGPRAEASAEQDAEFMAWDGYITGKNLRLEPEKRIVQSWRTTEFDDADPDSQIEVLLEPAPGGTRLTLNQTNVPDGHDDYQSGWRECYFEPMKVHFSKAGAA